MKPPDLSARLRQMAAAIESSKNPSRTLLIRDLRSVLAATAAAPKSYKVGDTVTWNSMGSGRKTGVVVGREEDIKNGRPGFEADLPDGTGAWGYDHEIISVKPA